jgi:hypothetical protein
MTRPLLDIGEPARATATFINDSGDLFDPVTVTFTVLTPDGVELPYTYPTNVARLSLGVYALDFPTTMRGRYYVEVDAEATVGREIEVDYINVKRSPFVGET